MLTARAAPNLMCCSALPKEKNKKSQSAEINFPFGNLVKAEVGNKRRELPVL